MMSSARQRSRPDHRALGWAAWGAAALVCCASLDAVAATRFAVVVGNNVGAGARPRLWFAEKDAQRFAATLQELGDFAPARVTLLRGRSVKEVRAAVQKTESELVKLRAGGDRTMLLFFFSGHSDRSGLELGHERLSYDELRRWVGESAADVKVAVVDACDSGALTQVKGGKAMPTIDFPLPPPESVEGVAFIASTAVGELAQESARLGGSFFSHHLETALRGPGDADSDGHVTLAEAFRYASSRTVRGTAGTEIGPQHPTYEMKMSGRGDVVLADLRRAQASLVLPADEGADFFVHAKAGVLAQVAGASTRLRLALPAGRYTIERRTDGRREAADVELLPGQTLELPGLTDAPFETARSKGGARPLEVFGGVSLASGMLANFGSALGGRVGMRWRGEWVAVRLRLDYVQKSVADEGLLYAYSSLGGAGAVLFSLRDDNPRLEVGLEAGYAWATQVLETGERFGSGDATGAAVIALSMPIGALRVGTDWSVGLHRFTLNGAAAFRWSADAALLVAYAF